MMRKVGCLGNLAELLVGFLVGSVHKVDFLGWLRKKSTSVFGLQVIIGRSLCVSGPFILQLSCGIISKLA